MTKIYSTAKKFSLIATAVLLVWIILAGASGIFPPAHQLLILGFAVILGFLVFVVIVTGVVVAKLKAMLEFFPHAFIEFLNDHLNLMFLRKVTGIGKEAIIEGCEHTAYSLPPLLTKMHEQYSKLRKQYKENEEEFRKIWKQESDKLITIFNKNYAFSGQTLGGGAIGLSNFSVDYSCRLCSKRREVEGLPTIPSAPELTPEELDRIITEPRPPTKIEKTMKNIEGSFEAYKKGLKYKLVEKVFLIIAVVSILSIVALFAYGRHLVDPTAFTATAILIGGVFVFAVLAIVTVINISNLRSAVEFYLFTWEIWKDEHNEADFLRRVIGVGDETTLLEPCPHISRGNLRNLLITMNLRYAELTKQYRHDKATFRELWKNELENLFNLYGLNFTFASQRVALKSPGTVRFAVVFACRACMDKVYGKGRFDSTRYLLAQQRGQVYRGEAWVAPPPSTSESEEVTF